MKSLEELCLNLILKEFERFHFAFTISKEEALKKIFDFLRRKYSYQLVSKLGKLKDEYIEFLINEHLEELTFDWFNNSHYFNSMEDILCRLPNLKKFCFPVVCNNGHLESIAKFCPKVVEINMSLSPVTDNGIKYLCKDQNGVVSCPELKKLLTGERCSVTDESMKCLIRDLPSLEIIDYPNTPKLLYDLHERDLPELKNIRRYKLSELDLLRFLPLPYYADLLNVCLNVCPKLKSMTCCITDKEQLNFFNNTTLVELHLQFTIFPEININNFLKINGNNLVSLKLHTCLLSISELVVCCPKLKHLSINKVNISDDDWQPVITPLVECTFQNTPVKEVVFLLLSSPKLKSISFNCCILFTEIKTHILRLVENRSVEKFTFERCWVEMNFVKDILLNGSSSMELFLIDCDYSVLEMIELREFAATLNDKPKMHINGLLDSSEEEIDYFAYYNSGYFYRHDLYGDDIYDMEDDMGSPSD